MLRPLAMLPLVTICACGSWIIEEASEGDGNVNWYGTVLDGPYTGDNGVFTGGELLAYDLAGDYLAEGTEPDPDSPGYWKLKVPADTPVALHLSAEGMLPTVWRGTTPGTMGYWYTGALFAYDAELWQPFFEQFDGQSGVEIQPLSDQSCWLWGAPLDPEAWVGADIQIVDGEGEPATVLAYHLNDDGLLEQTRTQSITYFLAFNLAPGDITLSVQATDGRAFDETWPAWGGEVVTAWYVALPSEDS